MGGAPLVGPMGMLPLGIVAPAGAAPAGYGGYSGSLRGMAASMSEGVWMSSLSDPTLSHRLGLSP
eukprot:10003160-Karenia_brevis.AAC.1